MKAFEIFSDRDLVKKIKIHQSYLDTLQEELKVRKAHADAPPLDFTKEAEVVFDYVFDHKIKELNNKKSISLLELEIDSKASYIKELTESLLRDKAVYLAEYKEYIDKSSGTIVKEQVRKLIEETGFKTPHHRNWIVYHLDELETYERNLQQTKAKGITDLDGIIEGIIWFYHQLRYALKDHDQFKITSK